VYVNAKTQENPLITIKEIAEQAEVSIGTVDRVLHNRGRVSEKTRKRILKIVEQEGYRKNIVASQLSNSRANYFAIIMPYPVQNDSFWQIIRDGIEAEKTRLSYFKLKLEYFYYDRFNAPSYGETLKEALKKDPQGILLAPVLAEEAISCAHLIPEKMKVVLINSDLPDFNKISYIGQNSYESGRTAGKLMALLTHNRGTIAVIEVQPSDYHINIRARGFKEYILKNSTSTIRTYLQPDENEISEFEESVKRIQRENEDLSGLFVPSSSVHYFAGLMEKYYKKKRINIIGYDLVEANASLLKEGKIDFLINQQPRKQGELGLEYLFKSTILQEFVTERKFLPIEIISEENLDSYTGQGGEKDE
jgi:LacI family transcriptional regulator